MNQNKTQQLSPQIFTIWSNEIEEALNPGRYCYSFSFVNKCPMTDVVDIVNKVINPSKKEPKLMFDWIRIDKVNHGGFLSPKEIVTTEGENINGSVQLAKEGDILLARLGPSLSNRKILICPKTKNKTVVSNEFIVLRVKNNYDISFVLSVLCSDIYIKYMLSKGRGATPSRLRLIRDDMAKLNFPGLPIQEQKILSKQYTLALDGKIKKKAEANKLLGSIDDYVLNELGIKAPEIKRDMVFEVMSDKIENNRIGAEYWQPFLENIEQIIGKSKYKTQKLKDFITKIHYGASTSNAYVDSGIPLLRILNLKPNYVDLSDVVYLPENFHKELGNAFVKTGDLLISRSGTVGIVSVVPKEADGFAFGSFMIKFCLNDEINKEFVSIWLNNKLNKLLTEREKIGAIQGNITIGTIENFDIPVPPLAIQNKIVEKINSYYFQAQKSKDEAHNNLQKAKDKVEQIILS